MNDSAPPADLIIDLYERNAANWDRDRGRDLFEKDWLDRFLARLPKNSEILDIGCGSGEPIARYLIEQGHIVTGVDTSGALIAICRERFPSATWIVSDMRSLCLGRHFDGLLAWDSFFHLRPEDQRRMFPVFRDHARPRAALMFTSGPRHGEVVGQYRGEPLYHGSLDETEYNRLLSNCGFDVRAHAIDDPTCGHHTIWLAKSTSSQL